MMPVLGAHICEGSSVTADNAKRPESANPAVAPAASLLAEIERLKAELAQAEWKIAELEARADVDPLLDILNRRGFERELARSLAYVKRYGTAAALILIDLDGFKAVDDRHVLKAVARQFVGQVRASDVVARLGGDEFAVLMWNLGAAQATAKAGELETAIAAAGVRHGDARLSVGASAGIVPLAPDATPAEISDAADKAMYAHKKQRRGESSD
jgi:diguanylate cyclase (GGDEF)-like protein